MGKNAVISVNDHVMDDTQQIIDAIRSGHVDAFVIEDREGRSVYTLQSADLPYSSLVQRMQQGAAMLNPAGELIYCNISLAALLGMSTESLVGLHLADLVHPEDRATFQDLLEASRLQSSEREVRLRRASGDMVSTELSITNLSRDGSVTGVLVSDLTTEKANTELAAQIQRLQDQERRNIARELHDSVGQLLAAISMNLGSLQQRADSLPPSLSTMLDDTNAMVAQVTREIRTISHLLHPPLLGVAGLCSAIRWYVDGFSERSQITVNLDIPSEVGPLSSEIEIALYRVVQECLTNVYRHSGSSSCSVKLERQQNQLRLEIRDSGKGMRKHGVSGTSAGVGLRGMKERLRLVGGTLEFASSETGTTVIVRVPSNEPTT